MPESVLSLEQAVDLTRTGDLWLFRGRSAADQAIRAVTNAPVNHVGMAVVLDDMPPLMWHAELGQGLLDVWSGAHHRGVQLHDLRGAVEQWVTRYGQRPWLRQLEGEVTPAMEDAVLRTIARMDGTPFPSTARLAGRWFRGRLRRPAPVESTYCAEVVAGTYQAMGLLGSERPTNYYDPGMFWSGDDLRLLGGATLGREIAVRVPGASG
ncbi:C40 family peptidase [Nocardioides pacificus]